MPNPLFSVLGGNAQQPDNGFAQMMQDLEDFKKNFTGNPRHKVQELLRTGQMSQEQFNALGNMASQIMGRMPRR